VVTQDRDNDTHFQAQYGIWLSKFKSKKNRKKIKTANGKSVLRPIIIGGLVLTSNIQLLQNKIYS